MMRKRQIIGSLLLIMMAYTMTAGAQEYYREQAPPATVQLRTNSLYYLAACPNVGVEIQTDLGIAWQLDYIGAWWNSSSHFYSNYALQTEARYYFMSRTERMPYYGHHVGLYGQMATYDFCLGSKGYLSRRLDYSWGVGVSYGYSFQLNRHWNLDLTMGIGYFSSQYDTYHPTTTWFMRDETRRLRYFGPTKLEVTFAWNINTKNTKKSYAL